MKGGTPALPVHLADIARGPLRAFSAALDIFVPRALRGMRRRFLARERRIPKKVRRAAVFAHLVCSVQEFLRRSPAAPGIIVPRA